MIGYGLAALGSSHANEMNQISAHCGYSVMEKARALNSRRYLVGPLKLKITRVS